MSERGPGYSRFLIIGLPSIGKTYFADRLARKYAIPHIEGDKYFWLEGGKHLSLEEFRQRIDELTGKGRWIYEGHYRKVYDILKERTDTLIWIDLSLFTALKRSFFSSKEEFGIKYTLTNREGPFLWLIFNARRMLQDYKKTLADFEALKLPTFRLKNGDQIENWLKKEEKNKK